MRRPDLPVLTFLRFPAALAIVLFHFLPLMGWSSTWCEGLVSGVSFFYVLSGFILYYNYVDLSDRRSFWVARFARIWPLHFVTFLMALGLLPFVSLMGHASWPITLPANLLLVQAWLPFQGSILSYNGVAWSLSVEAFFYLSFPWLLIALKQKGSWLVLTGAFLLGLFIVLAAQTWYPRGPDFGSFFPPCRVVEFILGMVTCKWWLNRKLQPQSRKTWSCYEAFSILMVLLLVLTIRPLLHELGLTSSLGVWLATVTTAGSFAGLIWIFAHQAGLVSRFLSTSFFVLLGEISFALYMCHQILLRWLRPEAFIPGAEPSWSFFGGYLLLSLSVSYVLFVLVEKPSRQWVIGSYRKWAKPERSN